MQLFGHFDLHHISISQHTDKFATIEKRKPKQQQKKNKTKDTYRNLP